MNNHNNTDNSLAFKALQKLRLRLLDLTSRNRLINYKHTKKGNLRIIDELPDQLVENLLSDVVMRFLAVPEPNENELLESGYLKTDNKTNQLIRIKKDPTAEEWARHLGFDTNYEVPAPYHDDNSLKHKDTAIQTLLYPYEMEARLKDLMHTSESAIQEMGANILYLALGFLEWFESMASENLPRIAPLFLVPVRLQKGRLNKETMTYEYALSYSGEDIISNLSLREKLKVDFGMALPELDENTIPEDYFNEVQKIINDVKPNWKIRRYISLTLLNFNKLLMYLDLDPARWSKDNSILEHPVVRRFLEGYGNENYNEDGLNEGYGFIPEYSIDETEDIHIHYPLIDNADSSQHSALIDAVSGKNLVIEGPPGTGKSQTITNLIAAAMSRGKKILFVAEKLAALEVVRRRLDNSGLGEFCLELHSHKSQKNRTLSEINERMKKNGNYRKPSDIEVDIKRFEELKTILKNHVEMINTIWKNTGKTIHDIFMAASRYRNSIEIGPEQLHPIGYNGDNYDEITQRRNVDHINTYGNVFRDVAAQLEGHTDIREHPWCGVRNGDLQLFDLSRVIESLAGWNDSLIELYEIRNEISISLNCEVDDIPESLMGLDNFTHEIDGIPDLMGDEILIRLPILCGDLLIKVRRYYDLFDDIQKSYESLASRIGFEPLQNLSMLEQFVKGGEHLKKLVHHNVDFTGLANSIKKLESMNHLLEDLKEPISGFSQLLNDDAAKHISLCESGIIEFKDVIDTVSKLNPSLWSFRSEHFDNEDLDEILPLLRKDLKEINELIDSFKHIVRIENLPSEYEIRELREILFNGGFFKWFKGSWRSARKKVLSYSLNSKGNFKKILPLLDNLAEFSGRKHKLENEKRYINSLGHHLNGVETDVEVLEALRSWYKTVRRQYGYGFGQKVALGNAILILHSDIVKALRSLSEQGMQQRIISMVDDLKEIRKVFAPVVKLHSSQTHLGGCDGLVPRLIKHVIDAVETCAPVAVNGTLKIAELITIICDISTLKQKVDKWINADIDRMLFKGMLCLNPGAGIDNSVGLSALRNTLNLAEHLDRKLSYKVISEFIYNNPTNQTFDMLDSIKERLKSIYENQENRFKGFSDLVQLDKEFWMHKTGDRVEEIIRRNDFAFENKETLQNWLDHTRIRQHIDSMGLRRIAEHVEKNIISIIDIENAYHAGIFDLLSREILKDNPELGRFSGRTQEAYQKQFREYDIKLMQLQCEQIAWKIDQNHIPYGICSGRVNDLTERALIERECVKKTRHIPIRQLIKRAGNALVALKPCFMMGPMSVAQYLAPGNISFDLVVMDEASQIKPQDALGAVARGGQLVVVGDPKQLPPTNFFEKAIDGDGDDDDITSIEESESILDATIPMFPARRLRWHYRSQHESLIAFSNHMFYESDLVLFPSPHKKTEKFGIQYSRVQRGCFVNRRNMEEAKVISEAVREHFRFHPDESLGVVAMSSEQRQQIERSIETLAKEDSLFQEWLDKDTLKLEPLFIKNLENVQGDERDVIFVSMTYGPPEPGARVLQRFGPINMDVGWRRLNVLFTRSKKRMNIFSSMGSDDVIIGPSSKKGIQSLHDFLRYCETGILHKTEKYSGRDPDSDFEIDVMNSLRSEGFECIPQVGVAGFFIDVAVVDPNNPGRYLMGIECDGATYHSGKSVRDRDRLRQMILERLGWRIRRIWSTDWFKNPKGELLPIIRELNELKETFTPIDDDIVLVNEEIEKIIEENDSDKTYEDYVFERGSLREKLIRFDLEVIRKEFPDTPDNKRLLRPSMVEALIEFTPTNKSEFLETIPSYIRQATKACEGKFLESVFEIINASIENA